MNARNFRFNLFLLAGLTIAPLAAAHPFVVPAASVYAVTNDEGQVLIAQETNGRLDGGIISYGPDVMGVGALSGDTGLQIHDACYVPGMDVHAWQADFEEGDPFYNYLPWQVDEAGFGDEGAVWLPWIQANLHVNLAAIAEHAGQDTVVRSCHDLGGSFVPHDAFLVGPDPLG